MNRPTRPLAVAIMAFAMIACDGTPTESAPPASLAPLSMEDGTDAPPDPTLVAAVGAKIFNDPNLSLRRNQACATCHDPAWGFTSPNATINAGGAVMFGSVSNRFGSRKPPSAAYATPSPVMHTDEVGTVIGGNFWDGRATGARLGSPAAEQAQFPFVNPVEQALPDVACVVHRVAEGKYGALYRAAWGKAISSIAFPPNTERLCQLENVTIPLPPAERAKVLVEYDRIARSIAAFEDSPEVNQFSSKYDAYLAGRATLTGLERRGLELYEGRAGCAGCHPSAGSRALFTDYTYDNIGVPSNPLNPARVSNPGFRDIGLGGFLRDASLNGAQKVPTLRNLDRRGVAGGAKAYMHNGVFKTLEDVVHFYNTRDVLPDCAVVPSPRSGVNCWPAPEVAENVNRDELGNLGLTREEERALVAYLKTLNDGYARGRP